MHLQETNPCNANHLCLNILVPPIAVVLYNIGTSLYCNVTMSQLLSTDDMENALEVHSSRVYTCTTEMYE